jgi:uncharacterized protein YpmS
MKTFFQWRLAVMICLAVVSIAGIDRKTLNALKVRHILREIESHQTEPNSNSKDLTAEVTQAELNAYIDHRLAKEKNQPIDSLKVALLDKNRVEGKLKVDGEQLNLSLIFGEQLDFDFKGVLHTRKGTAHLDLKALKLNGQPVSPQMLDVVIRTAAMVNGE